MFGFVTKQDNYLVNKPIKSVNFYIANDKRYNQYLIDNMYTIVFTCKQCICDLVAYKQLRWSAGYKITCILVLNLMNLNILGYKFIIIL